MRTIFSLSIAMGSLGCGGAIIEASSDELGGTGSESDGDSDEIGDVETGTSSTTSADGSTDESSTTDDPSTTETTDDPSTSEESTSEESTSESTSESTTESTTTESETVVDTACTESIDFEMLAIDADYTEFWEEYMSMLGEGLVLSMQDNQNSGVVTFTIDVPCDDTWHVWVRALDFQGQDSFYARVDGQPQDWAIYEVDCTNWPNQNSVYRWTELNWRDPEAFSCDYVQDPWTQEWNVGPHELELAYLDSGAVVKIWVTNTADMP